MGRERSEPRVRKEKSGDVMRGGGRCDKSVEGSATRCCGGGKRRMCRYEEARSVNETG